MKWLVTAIALLISAANAAEIPKPFLISGYDDVLRQADNTGLVPATKRLLAEDETFAGMAVLYRLLSDSSSDPGFIVISGTSLMFAEGAQAFLQGAGYPRSDLYFRSWLTQWSAENFKYDRIERVFGAMPGRKFILVLDNSDTSLAVSARLLRNQATRVSAIYLRQVVKRDAPKGAVPFIGAFEIARNEFASGRLTRAEVEQVSLAIVGDPQATRVVPDYAYCPIDFDPCIRVEREIADYCAAVRAKVKAICESRLLQR